MVHSFLLECRESVIQSSKHCQTDSQFGGTNAHKTINQQQAQSIVTKGNWS